MVHLKKIYLGRKQLTVFLYSRLLSFSKPRSLALFEPFRCLRQILKRTFILQAFNSLKLHDNSCIR